MTYTVMLEPRVENPATVMLDGFREFLEFELVDANRVHIGTLTELAGKNKQAAAKEIAQIVVNHIVNCRQDRKLPGLYVLDSICKVVGEPYKGLFAPSLPNVYEAARRNATAQQASSLRKLYGTWAPVFPSDVLRRIHVDGSPSSSAPVSPVHSAAQAPVSLPESLPAQPAVRNLSPTVEPASVGLVHAAPAVNAMVSLPVQTTNGVFASMPPQTSLLPMPVGSQTVQYLQQPAVAATAPMYPSLIPPGQMQQQQPLVWQGQVEQRPVLYAQPAAAPVPYLGGGVTYAAPGLPQQVPVQFASTPCLPSAGPPPPMPVQPQPVMPPVPAPPSNTSAVSKLLDTLVNLSKKAPTPVAPVVPELGTKFVSKQLKEFNPHSLRNLEEASQKTRPKFIDFQFLHKQKQAKSKGLCRSWYMTADLWLSGTAVDVQPPWFEQQADLSASVRETQSAAPSSVPEDVNQPNCAISGEKFEVYFDRESDSWHYKDAVRLTGEKAERYGVPDGAIVKVDCLADVKVDAVLPRNAVTDAQDPQVQADMAAATTSNSPTRGRKRSFDENLAGTEVKRVKVEAL